MSVPVMDLADRPGEFLVICLVPFPANEENCQTPRAKLDALVESQRRAGTPVGRLGSGFVWRLAQAPQQTFSSNYAPAPDPGTLQILFRSFARCPD